LILPEHLVLALKEEKINSDTVSALDSHFSQWECVLENVIQKECEFTSDLQYIVQEMSFWETLVKDINALKSQIVCFPVYNVVRLLQGNHREMGKWNKLLISLDERLSEGILLFHE
jgi:hypothetical protein